MTNTERFEIKRVELSQLKLIDKNARFMTQAKFNQLVDNIRRDGDLTTVPFCYEYKEGKYEVISGNHRVQAAQMAGLTTIRIMSTKVLSNDERRAIQISHNSLTGQDDLEILRELVNEIQDAALREYAAIDESDFESLSNVSYDIVQPSNDIVSMNLTFFDSDMEDIKQLCQEIEDSGKIEDTVLMPKEKLEDFLRISAEIQKKYSIKAIGLTVAKMAELAREQLGIE